MSDAGTRAADRAQEAIERRLRSVYRQAQREIIEKLDAQTQRMAALDAQKRAELAAGTITERDYKAWLMGQMFTQKQWKDKVDSVATTLLTANQQANAIVEGQKRAVFGENATYQAYALEKGMGADLSFGVYDSATVTRLLRDEPELLPRKVVNGQKDIAWNKHNISNAVVQGVIQGESIPKIAQRIARQTASTNMKAMTRYARTAMTGAQNAGRMEVLHEAQDMGIKVKKKWLATLDKRTRDAHAHLDGQVVDIDEPFESQLGPIMYPGDPDAEPGNVYNCRCTLVYVYPDHMPKEKGQRRDNISGELIEDMTYAEWKKLKEEKKSSIIDVEIDDITPCLVDAKTGRVVETEFRQVHPTNTMFRDWEFDWMEPERKGYNVSALHVKGKKAVEGLVAWKNETGFVHISLVEAAPHNNPHNRNNRGGKRYQGVGAHLFAEACKKSYDNGYGGFVSFEAKTALIDHYREMLGATQIGTTQRMFIDEEAALALIKKYYGGEK